MKFIMTVILLYACLSINAQQSTTEMKKIIDAMQDMYHVNFVYDSSLANIKPKSAPLSGSSLVENLKRVFSGYIWRGQDLGNISIQPSASISYKGICVQISEKTFSTFGIL